MHPIRAEHYAFTFYRVNTLQTPCVPIEFVQLTGCISKSNTAAETFDPAPAFGAGGKALKTRFLPGAARDLLKERYVPLIKSFGMQGGLAK